MSGSVIDEYVSAEEVNYYKSQNAFKKGIMVNPDFNIGLFLCRGINSKDFRESDSYGLDDFKDINRNGRLVSENGIISYLDYPIYNKDEELFVVVYNPERKNHRLELDIIRRKEIELDKDNSKKIKEEIIKDYGDILNEYPYLKRIMDKERFDENETRMINRIIRHEFPLGSGFWGIGRSGRIVEYKWEDKIFETKQFDLEGNNKIFHFGKNYFKPEDYMASFDVNNKGVIHASVGSIPFIISD